MHCYSVGDHGLLTGFRARVEGGIEYERPPGPYTLAAMSWMEATSHPPGDYFRDPAQLDRVGGNWFRGFSPWLDRKGDPVPPVEPHQWGELADTHFGEDVGNLDSLSSRFEAQQMDTPCPYGKNVFKLDDNPRNEQVGLYLYIIVRTMDGCEPHTEREARLTFFVGPGVCFSWPPKGYATDDAPLEGVRRDAFKHFLPTDGLPPDLYRDPPPTQRPSDW